VHEERNLRKVKVVQTARWLPVVQGIYGRYCSESPPPNAYPKYILVDRDENRMNIVQSKDDKTFTFRSGGVEATRSASYHKKPFFMQLMRGVSLTKREESQDIWQSNSDVLYQFPSLRNPISQKNSNN